MLLFKISFTFSLFKLLLLFFSWLFLVVITFIVVILECINSFYMRELCFLFLIRIHSVDGRASFIKSYDLSRPSLIPDSVQICVKSLLVFIVINDSDIIASKQRLRIF